MKIQRRHLIRLIKMTVAREVKRQILDKVDLDTILDEEAINELIEGKVHSLDAEYDFDSLTNTDYVENVEEGINRNIDREIKELRKEIRDEYISRDDMVDYLRDTVTIEVC